jgi:hypothetical protein
VSNRQVLGLAAVACAACCIGPILGVIGAIAALGVISSLFIGVAALVVAAVAVATFIVVRHRRVAACGTIESVPLELGQPSR